MSAGKKMVEFDESNSAEKSSSSKEDIDAPCYEALFKKKYKLLKGDAYVMKIVHKPKELQCYATLKIKCSSPTIRFQYEGTIVGDDFWTEDEDRAIENVFLKAYLTLKARFNIHKHNHKHTEDTERLL